MSSDLMPPRPRLLREARSADVLGIIAVVAFCLLVLLVIVPALQGPSYIDELTIENPHQWHVNVDASDSSRDGWVSIGPLSRESTVTVQGVIDQGERWVFRFSYGGIDGGQLELTRPQLEQSGWKINVPDDFARRMQAAELEPSD